MRLSLSLLGCRLLICTGSDTEDEPPAVISNVSGSFDPAPLAEPDPDPEDTFGFHGGRPCTPSP